MVLLIDLHDVSALTQAMRLVLTSADLRKQMIQKGLARAREFSWQKTAEETWRVYQQVAGLSEAGKRR